MRFLHPFFLWVDQPDQHEAADFAYTDEVLFLRGDDRSPESLLPDNLFGCRVTFGRIGSIKFVAHDLDIDGAHQGAVGERPLLVAVID